MKMINICVLMCVGFVLISCTANKPYRTELPVTGQISTNRPACAPHLDPDAQVIETNGNFKIGYVEFDDEGWFWSHNQWDAVKTALRNEAANSPDGLTIVVFVHGWKNNAARNNPNVETFRSELTNLSVSLGPRKVFGIYVGWRGLSAESDIFPPFGEELTFYARKATAERIGHQGAATQVFTELQLMQEEFNASTNKPTELIVIGHSFGGQLVYSAVSQILIERLLDAQKADSTRPVRPLGTLVILLNPALEASLFNNLMALATSGQIHYPTNQTPVLAVFTSQSDDATGVAFPIGRSVSTLFERTRPSKGCEETNLFNVPKGQTPDEKKAILETIGHDSEFITHDLIFTNLGKTTAASSATTNRLQVAANVASLQTTLLQNNIASNLDVERPYVFTNSIGGTNYACILQSVKNHSFYTRPRNPIFNVSVDPRIMNGHGDITNPRMLAFIHDFILFTHTNFTEESSNSIQGQVKQELR